MMTTTNPNTAFKTTDSLIKTATKHPHNHIADTLARDTHTLWQRSLVAIALLVTCVLGVKAEKYVIYYQQNKNIKYYMANESGTLKSTTTYDAATCVWVGESGGTLSNNGMGIYITSTSSSPSLTNAGRSITIDADNYIYCEIASAKYYIYFDNKNFKVASTPTTYGDTRVKAEVVEVTPPTPEPESITISPKSISLLVGKTETVSYTLLPDGAYDKDVKYTMSNENVASVDENGVITAKSVGNAILTVTANKSDGTVADHDECEITVTILDPEEISVGDLNLIVGETKTISYTLKPAGAYDRVEFYIADESIATIGINDVVTGKKAGSTSLTTKAYKYDGDVACSTTSTITVMQRCATPTIHIERTTKEVTITCSEPADATIYYTTDGTDPAIARASQVYTGPFTITGGMVKAIAVRDGWADSHVGIATLGGNGENAGDPYQVSSTADLNYVSQHPTYHYKVVADFDASGFSGAIADFSGTFDGGFYTISGLTSPLFATTSGATIKNVVLDQVNITGGTDNVGAIAGTASGATRIYNCGVLSGSIGGDTNVGSIAGSLNDEARVINCYSYANITDGNTVGGIVGYNSVASTTSNLKTLVMNCMFYGDIDIDITGGTSVSPIYGGQKISNAGSTSGNTHGINNYNYYRHEAKITPTAYNCALAAEERYLTRFEFYRHVLNSQRKLCAFYVTGSIDNYEEIAKWVLDVSDPNAPKYPILKPWGKYASMMNRAATNKSGNKLTVKISGTNATEVDISATTKLDITNADPETHDYNHYKVQLPYYNDHFTDNYTNNKVVTGWKITSITGGTEGTFSTTDNNRYNFADRHCTQKDLYSVSGRVFAQGGFFNVPEGVTDITIEPYWGKAVYLSDAAYDVVYTTGYAGKFFQPAGLGETPSQFNEQTVHKSMSDVWKNLQSGVTVFDNAIVLVGNYHSYDETWENSSGGKPFTIMSVDIDKDNEPDYGLYFKTSVRVWINPVRFDFINHVALGMAAKVEGNSTMPNIAIFRPKGWFEITETALAIYEEFEYDWHDTGKALAPLILNGGIFNQFCSINVDGETVYNANRTQYTIVGGNSYFKSYTPGCQSGEVSSTAFPPVSILGGEYENFYLSGLQAQATPIKGHNALCYGNGGKIGMFAGACQEAIDGDVIIKLDHMLIDEFYGGGINDKKPITGNINVTINNSQVGIYCGGPKFGNMATGKAITTYAENTTFGRADEPISGRFFGAGYGGTSLYRYRVKDVQDQTTYDQSWLSNYTGDRGEYYNTGGNDRGIMVSYETEHFCYAGGGNVNARFFTNYASLSVAEVKNVTTTLKGCTINGDLYGGGNLGKASGNISTTLENCIVKGSSYAAGFSAAAPTCEVMPTTPPTYSTYNGNTGIFTPVKYPKPEIFTWAQADAPLEHGLVYINDTKKEIYTKAVDLSDLGTVRGNTTIEIKGDNSHIYGSVFGGGNASKVIGNTHVHIQGGTIDGNVFGAGNQAEVTGKTEVVIGE